MTFQLAKRLSLQLATAIVFLMLFPVLSTVSTHLPNQSAHAAETHRPVPVLSVSGTGIVNAEPDIAYISSGVISEAKTAQKALDQNNKKMADIFGVLTKIGIERKHIQTSNFSVQPRYNHYRPKPGEVQKAPKIVGYTVHNTVTVKVNDLAKLGKTITEVVQFGSNQLGNIRFDLSNKQELLDQARSAAVLDAKRKAEIYTSAAGVKIGRLVSLSEGTRHINRPKVQSYARTAKLEAAPTPVSGGEQQLSFTVAIKWEIEQ
ncbi:MAG: SIMPL domain-containing protein [Hyphomicrobiales bacterium]